MDRNIHERAEQIFADAAELDPDRRDRYAIEVCAGDQELLNEVRSLLHAAEDSEDFFSGLAERLGGALSASAGQTDRPVVGRSGMAIGPYELREPLGHGGSGTVWLARRSDGQFEGRAAVKLMNPWASTTALGRLGQEAQHLAKLAHPNIARLLDAGVDDEGHPYLILEYVEGTAIDHYCDTHSLDIRERIRLFIDVLRAVAHAHSHLVVHRDIKPSNVLVDRTGAVKLLDFGIARLLRPEELGGTGGSTVELAAALTPEFAAPEQLTGQSVTTSTDVYSLGLLLYVLLAGCNPRDGDAVDSFAKLVEIAAQDPPKASTIVSDRSASGSAELADRARRRQATPESLQRRLRGDLDNILRKALAAAPADRYESATDFAADLNRFLRGEPVSAMPPTVAYRMHRFVGRHRGGVLSACLTAIALIAAVVVTTTQMLEARQQRDIARYQQQRVQASNEFYSLLLEDIGADGNSFTAVQLLDRGVEMLEQQYGVEQPFIGRIHYDLSRRYSNMRERNRELELLGLAENAARANGDDDLLAAALCAAANSILFSDPEAARAKVDEANSRLSKLRGPSIDSSVACLRMDAHLAEKDGDRQAAMTILENARRQLDASPVAPTHLLGITLNDLANLYFKEARFDESLSVLNEILELLEKTGRGNTLGYLQVLANRSAILGSVGEVVAELAIKEQLIERMRQSSWGDNRASISYRHGYAHTLIRLSRHEEAIRLLESIRDEAEQLGSDINVAMADLGLAGAFVATDRFDEAEARISMAEAALAGNPRAWEFQAVRAELLRANIARKQGRLEEARAQLATILNRYGYPAAKDLSSSLAAAIGAATMVELAAEDYEAAERLASDYLSINEARARRPDMSADVGNALFLRARARIGQGRSADAIDDLRRAVISLGNGLGQDNRETTEARELLQRSI